MESLPNLQYNPGTQQNLWKQVSQYRHVDKLQGTTLFAPIIIKASSICNSTSNSVANDVIMQT